MRFGAEGNGATRFDQSEARKVLLKSVLAFDAFSEAERAAATGAAESGVAAQCAALACKTWPSASSSSFDRNISPSSPSLREDETDTDVVVRVVTVASEPRPELTAMKSAARQLGLGPVSVLGLGLPWPGLGQKVVLLHDWLKRSLRDGSVHASDLVNEWTHTYLLLQAMVQKVIVERVRVCAGEIMIDFGMNAWRFASNSVGFWPLSSIQVSLLSFRITREISNPLLYDTCVCGYCRCFFSTHSTCFCFPRALVTAFFVVFKSRKCLCSSVQKQRPRPILRLHSLTLGILCLFRLLLFLLLLLPLCREATHLT